MASVSNRRITAIILQSKLNALFAAVQPLYAQAAPWNVSGIDDDLPPEGEVKAVLDGYTALAIPGLNTREALQDVALSTDTFSGVFAVPATTFPWIFSFSGPIYAGQVQTQGFAPSLKIERVTAYIGAIGTAVPADFDVKIGDQSIFPNVMGFAAVPVNQAANWTIPQDMLNVTTIPANSFVSCFVVGASQDAADLTVTLWLKP